MPWYRAGTVTATAGQVTIVGANTNFSANSRVGDAFQGPDGRWYEVTNIASANVLSILPAYQGGTVAGGSYGLAPMQGYVKESADKLRQFVEQFGGVLAIFGSASTPETARAALGVGSAGTRNAGSYPGQVMLVGDRNSPLAENVNSWGNSFQMWESVATAGGPEPSSFGTIINAAWGTAGTYGTQIIMSVTGRIWFRAGDYATTLMHEIYHTGNTTRAADGTLKAI